MCLGTIVVSIIQKFYRKVSHDSLENVCICSTRKSIRLLQMISVSPIKILVLFQQNKGNKNRITEKKKGKGTRNVKPKMKNYQKISIRKKRVGKEGITIFRKRKKNFQLDQNILENILCLQKLAVLRFQSKKREYGGGSADNLQVF